MVTNWRSPIIIISSGCLIAMFGFGTRSMFGFFLEPMTEVHVWSREQFSLAMAIQNLLWGLTVPIAGAVADKYGPMRVLMLGAVFYSLGIIGMANSETALSLNLFGGLLTGIGVAFTSFSIVMAAIARVVHERAYGKYTGWDRELAGAANARFELERADGKYTG